MSSFMSLAHLHSHQTRSAGKCPSGSRSSTAPRGRSTDRPPWRAGKCPLQGIPWDRPADTPPRCQTCYHCLCFSKVLPSFPIQTFTATIVKRHAPLLRVVKVPLGVLVLARSRGPGQEAHGPGAAAVLATVLTLRHGHEAVEVACAFL